MDNINLNRENGQKLWATDWNKLVSTVNLIIDAVNNQNNLPGITKLSQLVNDSGFITEEDISGKVNKNELALVASTGNYNDLINKPTYTTGPQGPEGKSAYQIAVANGFVGTQQLWLNSLKGENGLPGLNGQDGLTGADGKSAYEIYIENIPQGTSPLSEQLWLLSLHGQNGLNGQNGVNGTNGKSAYQSYLDTTTDNPPLTELQWANNDYNNLKNKPSLATVATSGSYNDLNDRPGKFEANGHNYVEIGGIKWATMNLGANSVTDIGLYYLWGDTQGYTIEQVGNSSDKKYFGWSDYKYGGDDNGNQTKYNSLDNLTTLESSDDAVTAAWGGTWRMPTMEEFLILHNNTNIRYESNYLNSGVSGLLLTDKTDSNKQIFFPYTGYFYDGIAYTTNENEGGYYWTKSLWTSSIKNAYYAYINYYESIWDNKNTRRAGFNIRGVLDGFDDFSKVAFTGNYNDLTNKPTISAALILSDWNQTDNTQVDYIKNKPTITNGTDGVTPHIDSTSKHWMIGSTDTGVIAEGLNGVTPHIDSTTGNWFIGNTDTGVHALGPAGQGGSGSGVLSDWNETDNTSLAYIANKPTIPTVPSNETATSGGSTLSVVTTGDKYNWNNKASIWSGTQAQYDALSPNYDSNTIYIITAAS